MLKTDVPPSTLQQKPKISSSAFMARGAQVIGAVELHDDASVWYNAVLRGDINSIVIGARSNIQDGSVIHVENTRGCVVGQDVTVGHHVNLHACTVEDACLIGIGAIVLSGAHIGQGSIIGAGSLILEDTKVEPYSLMVGSPARKIRSLDVSTFATHKQWARKYMALAALHRQQGFHQNNQG